MQVNVDDLGKLLLRVLVGGLMLFHGAHKVLHGIGGIVGMVGDHGIPSAFAYGVFVGEVLAPVLLVLGVLTRVGGLLVATNMVVAILLVHTADLLTLARTGGWSLELQAFYLFGGLAIALLGAGRYGLGGARGRWN